MFKDFGQDLRSCYGPEVIRWDLGDETIERSGLTTASTPDLYTVQRPTVSSTYSLVRCRAASLDESNAIVCLVKSALRLR